MGGCLAALLRGEDSEESEAGALTLADAMHELRAMRRTVEALLKVWSK